MMVQPRPWLRGVVSSTELEFGRSKFQLKLSKPGIRNPDTVLSYRHRIDAKDGEIYSICNENSHEQDLEECTK